MAEASAVRIEHDSLGAFPVPDDRWYGIHTARALENTPRGARPVPQIFLEALIVIKQAAARINGQNAFLDPAKAAAIAAAGEGLSPDDYRTEFPLPIFQGGAGTSTNMNVNEVLANRAEVALGGKRGEYRLVHPNDDVNRHQSTNDVYPTALAMAALRGLAGLAGELAALQTAFQEKETEFHDILKTGRTELQDALPITLGRECGAWAEAFARDRWRVSKARERLRTVNIGGTAIGTGTGAPRAYLFAITDEIRRIWGEGLAQAENLVDATQNADRFVEASGILKTCAVNLIKVSNDLRLLSSGPDTGIGELLLAPLQAGSSLMPGKVNPVAPELAALVGYQVIANDAAVTAAAAAGQLELNAFLPLITANLLESIDLLSEGVRILNRRCICRMAADRERCRNLFERSMTGAGLLAPYIGYEAAASLAGKARAAGTTLAAAALAAGSFTEEELAIIFDPTRATAPGIAGAEALAHRLPHGEKQ